jgi:hypothetical protein
MGYPLNNYKGIIDDLNAVHRLDRLRLRIFHIDRVLRACASKYEALDTDVTPIKAIQSARKSPLWPGPDDRVGGVGFEHDGTAFRPAVIQLNLLRLQ